MDFTVIPSIMRLFQAGVMSGGGKRIEGISSTAVQTGAASSVVVLAIVAALYICIGAYAVHLCNQCNPGRMDGEKLVHNCIAFIWGPSAIPLYSMFGSSLCSRPVSPVLLRDAPDAKAGNRRDIITDSRTPLELVH